MKSWLLAIVLCSSLMIQGAAVRAQGVFVTQGEHGPVFSDKPQSGAKEVTLRPLSVIDTPRETKAAAGKTGAAALPANSESQRAAATRTSYQSLLILSPEEEGSVIVNSGAIDVRLSVDPSLQLGEGHAFMVSVNGRRVGQRFTSTEMTIPPEFWGGMPPANQFAQLDVSVVDESGRELIKATPVRFFMRYTTVLNNPNRFHPFPVITPIRPIAPIVPSSQPKTTPEKASPPRISVGGAR
ncbi:MAG: hypothetical protein WCK63_00520 [Betaproteobacteria bacterium]